ncbi:unnamed protein product [Spirodela intermedia]|uniref:DEK-C domain-containing protein n=2 Tax=Spirodela intermedia TaxID=51605 RepID=A0A7I8KH32_SPIIN|nr:unnamed protein product [Spirodela intermedia]CAA6659987.1 unnamed protein product [Spirodela intermedia]CAA7396305.1 unnamed protein product [Spirodela intermedia]
MKESKAAEDVAVQEEKEEAEGEEGNEGEGKKKRGRKPGKPKDEGTEMKEIKAADNMTVQEEKEEAEGEEGNEVEGKKKRGRKPGKPKDESTEKKVAKKKQAREAKPTVERPTRERKTVERFSEMSPQSASGTKAVSIKQGSGTKLKDIPNVFYKISKRKADENLQLLHTILFAKKAKVLYLKRNIYQFSGFVWTENEEKQKAKVKEKLDKCVKDKLLDFCDILDVPVSRATMKKEDISAKLLGFLESPHATRDVILAEKEQKQKKGEAAKLKNDESDSGDDSPDSKSGASDDEELEDDEGKRVEKRKGRSSGKDKEPTVAEMHAVVRDILKEVDFNTATLADILKQLGSHFRMDLMHRKAEVKSIIEEVINDMTDDEDDDGTDGQE